MRRDEVLKVIRGHRPELHGQFGVRTLRIFGSVARDDASATSDVDVLVSFERTPSLFEFLRLRGYLEELLGAKVDLVTETGLRERVRPYVERDAVSVA